MNNKLEENMTEEKEDKKPKLVAIDGGLLAPAGKEPPSGNWLKDMANGVSFLCRPKFGMDGRPYTDPFLNEYTKLTETADKNCAYLRTLVNEEKDFWVDANRFYRMMDLVAELKD